MPISLSALDYSGPKNIAFNNNFYFGVKENRNMITKTVKWGKMKHMQEYSLKLHDTIKLS